MRSQAGRRHADSARSELTRLLVGVAAIGGLFWLTLGGPDLFAGPPVEATGEGQLGETPEEGSGILGLGGAGWALFGGLDMGSDLDIAALTSQPDRILYSRELAHGGFIREPYGSRNLEPFITGFLDATPVSSTMSGFSHMEIDPKKGEQDAVIALTSQSDDGTTVPSVHFVIIEDIPTIGLDPFFSRLGIASGDPSELVVVYNRFGKTPALEAQRIATAGSTIGDPITLSEAFTFGADVAALDADRYVIVTMTASMVSPQPIIEGMVLDVSQPMPTPEPTFPVSTTAAALANALPVVVAAPPGAFSVVWEHRTLAVGNEVDVRARRFDSAGSPIGLDFQVNTTSDGTQDQPDVAVGADGESVVVWTSDTAPEEGAIEGLDALDVYAQVFDVNGLPLGNEFRVNDSTTGYQDQPDVEFLPDDESGRSQFIVVWRDVGNTDGTMPNGTGISYRCFAFDDGAGIFGDGFESGDTTSWSATHP